MLHINDLTYGSKAGRSSNAATAAIPSGHKVGLVGRNGAGKTTLLRLLKGEIAPDDGAISIPRNAPHRSRRAGGAGRRRQLIDWVLSADTERASLLAEAEHATDPHRIAEIQMRLTDIDAHSAPARAARILSGLGFDDDAQRRACREFSGGWRMRVALGAILFLNPKSCCSTSRPTISISKARSGSRTI